MNDLPDPDCLHGYTPTQLQEIFQWVDPPGWADFMTKYVTENPAGMGEICDGVGCTTGHGLVVSTRSVEGTLRKLREGNLARLERGLNRGSDL